MEVTQFYLHLSSNSSLDKFPKNTLSEYRVGLPQTIILSGDWEVALTDIHYPHSWNNVQGVFPNRFYLRNPKLHGVLEALIIPPGHYSSITDVIAKMNEVVGQDDRFKDDVQLSFDTLNRKVTVHVQNGAEVYLSDVGQMLGFSSNTRISSTSIAAREADLEQGFHDLYVYSEMRWYLCFELSPWKLMTVNASVSRLSARTTYLSSEESLNQCHFSLGKCCLHFIFVRAEPRTFKRDEETLHSG